MCASVNGHLGYFHLLIIWNNAMNIPAQIFVCKPVFNPFVYTPRGRTVVAPFYSPTSNVWRFPFLHMLPNTYLFSIKKLFFFNDHRSGYGWASLVSQRLKRLPAMRETWVQSLGQEDPLEKEMATHSSTLAWRIPWTEEPGRLQSTGSQRVGHDWVTSLSIVGMKWFLVVVLICIFHDD